MFFLTLTIYFCSQIRGRELGHVIIALDNIVIALDNIVIALDKFSAGYWCIFSLWERQVLEVPHCCILATQKSTQLDSVGYN